MLLRKFLLASGLATGHAFISRVGGLALPRGVRSFAMAAPQLAFPLPPLMDAVHLDQPFAATTLAELARLDSKRVFVMANRSSRGAVQPLLDALAAQALLAAPLFADVGMGGGEAGILAACDAAAGAGADAVVSVGGGAVQDAAKIVRMWLSCCNTDLVRGGTEAAAAGAAGPAVASLALLQLAAKRDPMPPLPPQVALPNSFAMAELTSVAGVTTTTNAKSGLAHSSLMPTVVVFDPALTHGLPDWVRFGTGLRCVEHAVGAATHPNATPAIVAQALAGLTQLAGGLNAMVAEPESRAAAVAVYAGGALAIRALNTGGCYPALGHLVANLYSAKFDVHQGACSGILCARLLAHHAPASAAEQQQIAKVLLGAFSSDGSNVGGSSSDGRRETLPSAARLAADLAARLPGVECEHFATGRVSPDALAAFAAAVPLARFNALSPAPFANTDEFLAVITRPLDTL